MIDDFDQPEISFGTVWAFISRHRRVLFSCAVVGSCVLGVAALVQAREYTAFASFIPETKSNTSPIAGIAAEFGLSGLDQQGSQSPQFFADLISSPTVLRQVVTTQYTFARDGIRRSGSLVDVYQAHGATPAERVEEAIKKLSKHVTAHVSSKTGLVTLSVRAPSADLAVQIAQQFLNRIDALNLQFRQSDAAMDRQFAEQEATALGDELRVAEDRLQAFVQANRNYNTSSRLLLEQERLAREVSLRQETYESMASTYERARIEAARHNPVVEVVDLPVPPARPDSRELGKWLFGGFLLGALAGVLLSGASELLWDSRSRRGVQQRAAGQPLIVSPNDLARNDARGS